MGTQMGGLAWDCLIWSKQGQSTGKVVFPDSTHKAKFSRDAHSLYNVLSEMVSGSELS